MARLYEMWVWGKLVAAYPEQIEFQVQGHCKTAVDFIKKDEKSFWMPNISHIMKILIVVSWMILGK